MQMIILFGGTSYIGKNLSTRFSSQDRLLTATYFNSPEKNMHYFDLQNPDIASIGIDLSRATHAVICSGITRPDDCKRDEKKSRKINVEGTKNLLEQLFQLKIFPVFFSSEYVFDGKKGNYSEEDKPCPCTVYGNQKKEIENYLLSCRESSLILRLSKVFGMKPGDNTILTSTLEQLVQNKTIKCATDQIFSPTCIEDVANSLELAIAKKLTGLYNLASPEYFSRYELAVMLKSELQIKSGNVIPCSITDFKFLDNRPLNTSLNSEKLIKEGASFTKIEECIKQLGKK